MRRVSFAQMNCPIARTLDVVGDWWTLLILRDAVIWKVSRFDDFRHSLGITASVLTERLRSLVEAGLLERRDAPRGRSPHKYVPTQAGLDLLPTLLALAEWGGRYIDTPLPRVRTEHTVCGATVEVAPWCPQCGRVPTTELVLTELPPA